MLQAQLFSLWCVIDEMWLVYLYVIRVVCHCVLFIMRFFMMTLNKVWKSLKFSCKFCKIFSVMIIKYYVLNSPTVLSQSVDKLVYTIKIKSPIVFKAYSKVHPLSLAKVLARGVPKPELTHSVHHNMVWYCTPSVALILCRHPTHTLHRNATSFSTWHIVGYWVKEIENDEFTVWQYCVGSAT